MKQYYYVRLYQISKWSTHQGNKTVMCNLIDDYHDMPQVKNCEFNEITTIIVEKYSPFLVREITTGIPIPIVDISKCLSKEIELYSIEFPFDKCHTFIFSKFDKILGRKIEKTSELAKYFQIHQDKQQFKEELTKIIKTGNNIIENRKANSKKLLRYKK